MKTIDAILADQEEMESEPWWSFGLPIIFGFIALVVGTWALADSWAFPLTATAIAAAATSVGGLLGFLFGIPRSTIGDGGSEGNGLKLAYRPSTNLEQISDWLTKL